MSRYLLGDKYRRCPHCGGIEGAKVQPLTARQAQLYDFLEKQSSERGWAPSFAEIQKAFRFRSPATVHEHLGNLERKGWIKRRYNEARSIDCLVRVDR